MNFKLVCLSTVFLLTVFLAAFLAPAFVAGNYEKTYSLQTPTKLVSHPFKINIPHLGVIPTLSGSSQTLYISIQPSLYSYYGNLTHAVNSDSDYANYVTPQAVMPIAEEIKKVTDKLPNSDEQFADVVLSLVHQITYNVTAIKYPVETIVDNQADCVGLSLLAASIMEAGGLDVVLFLYTGINPQHMNVGVYLPHTPVYHTTLMIPTSFIYNNKTYWTAEATPAGDWRVGDQSIDLANAQVSIIPLGNDTEPQVLGQVSASLGKNLLESTITVNLSEAPATPQNTTSRSLVISGAVSPAYADMNVSICITNKDNPTYYWASTDENGSYCLLWDFTDAGTYYVSASWAGTSGYAGSDSETVPVFVGPQSFIQFDAGDYNVIFGQVGIAAYATLPLQGVNNFMSIPLGTNVSLSYSFIVLQAGQITSNVPTTNITVPASTQRVYTANRIVQVIQVPARNITVPVNVPIGMEPLRLPDNFNETINNQFCFVLQNNSGNYSLNVAGLSQEDLAAIQPNSVTNLTDTIKQDAWYNVAANITDAGATANLTDENGTVLANTCSAGNQTVILITNNADTAIVLKNIAILTQNSVTEQPIQATLQPTSARGKIDISLFVVAGVLLIGVIAAGVFLSKRKSKSVVSAKKS